MQMEEEVMPYPCTCGGTLKKSQCEVEFFGIDFGLRECEICTSCGSEYLSQETMKEVEEEVKSKRIFGLERNVKVSKSGNSLVIRIPKEIAEFMNLKKDGLLRLFPVESKRLEIEVLGD